MPEQPFNGKGRTDGVRVRIDCDQDGIFGGEAGIKFIKLGFPGFSLDGMNLLGERSMVHNLEI